MAGAIKEMMSVNKCKKLRDTQKREDHGIPRVEWKTFKNVLYGEKRILIIYEFLTLYAVEFGRVGGRIFFRTVGRCAWRRVLEERTVDLQHAAHRTQNSYEKRSAAGLE